MVQYLHKKHKSRTFHGSRPQTMGRAWPQTTPNGKQSGWFQAKNPECSMVAARKPWDTSGLKLLYKYKLNIIEINVRINTESFCFHLISYLYLIYQHFLAWAVEVCVKFSIHSILFICKVTTGDILVPNFTSRWQITEFLWNSRKLQVKFN